MDILEENVNEQTEIVVQDIDVEELEQEQDKPEKKTVWHWILVVIGIILCMIYIPILIINGIFLAKTYIDHDRVPMLAGYAPLIVLSNSMYPDMKKGDLIVTKETSLEDVQVDDVITFYASEDQTDFDVITHRVVEIRATDSGEISFVTKGDVNTGTDSDLVTQANFIGKRIVVFPGVGDIIVFLSSPAGIIICVSIPLVIFLLYEILKRKRFYKKKDKDTEKLLQELEELKRSQSSVKFLEESYSGESSEESKSDDNVSSTQE
ncbi:MAG: signal peptidase I [Clostridia bacterium]|nr:signal peptidase I [Clostridia bacterium]